MGYASSARRTWSASRSASLYTATADIPRSRQARMTRTAISPRFATRILRKGAVSSGPLACGPSRWPRVGVVPAAVLAVDPFGVGVEARAHSLVEGVLLRRVRVLHVRLAARESHDKAGTSLFPVLPQDLGAEVADRALAIAIVPLLAEREEVAQLVLADLESRDRPVHRCPPFRAGCWTIARFKVRKDKLRDFFALGK